MTSPELTGGAGFTYEDAVTAHYLVGLVAGTTATGLAGRIVARVAQQQADFGEPLDDVIVDALRLADGTTMRLSLQVKRDLTISAASSNSDFRAVIQHSWLTVQKADFREHIDLVGAATGSVSEDPFRIFNTVCEWARASDGTAAFMQRFAEGGNAAASHRTVAEAVRQIGLGEAAEPMSDDQLHRLFSHLTLIKFDFLQSGSTHDAQAVADLQRSLVPSQVGHAGDLWVQLRQLARDGAGRSAVHTRASVLRNLSGWRFKGAPALAADMDCLRVNTRTWLAQQSEDIGGMHLDRRRLRDKLASEMAAHRLTLIKGLPGAGKTVLLRDLVQQLDTTGTTLFLPANRLFGRSWSEYARTLGLSNISIEALLTEISATGHTTLLIDGLDRIAPEHRAIVTDLLGQLLHSPALIDWRVVATARDAGIEPLRNWIPADLLASNGVGYVDVDNLSDEEAQSLARALPALRPLLTGGDERVRTLARRPFFASVLARGFSQAAYPADFAPTSEVELIDAWWSRGGYDSESSQALIRQRALIELAQRSAPNLGRTMRLRDLSVSTQSVLIALAEDGLVQQVRAGHNAQFSHDIFFEWSFFHLLVDEGPDWIATLTDVGEPPALARVVELLSQATYADPEQWTHELRTLEQAAVRPQWLRAWVIAPVFGPRFAEHATAYARALAANEHRLLGKLLVWMQAEKTTPNPLVLSGHMGGNDLSSTDRIRLADSLGWPSDGPAWSRLILWALDQQESIPEAYLPDLVSLFNTWQIVGANYANPVSQRIIEQCVAWLQVIELQREAWRRPDRTAETTAVRRPRAPGNQESSLRTLVLLSARAYPTVVGTYLTEIAARERLGESRFRELMALSPVLATTHPTLLADIARRSLMAELPDETVARWRSEGDDEQRSRQELQSVPRVQRSRLDQMFLDSNFIHHSFSGHDWRRLSIDADQGFFPVSPVREPFHSLLSHSPEIGLSLIRDVVNHAVTAWRQLHNHFADSLTPLPLILTFPWGEQQFLGDDGHYAWFRGRGGPYPVECALMALERWALAKSEAGRPLDEVIRQVLEGHTSIAVLGIAVHLALRSSQVSGTTLTLLGSMRLCRLDMHRRVAEREGGQLESRRLELRDLIPHFVLGSDETMRSACRTALDAFPNRLEFAHEEDALNVELVSDLRRSAELWSELGHVENYSANPVPGREDAVQISVSSPRHEAQDVLDARQRIDDVSRRFHLWHWVEQCFDSKQWVHTFTPAEAVSCAIALAQTPAGGIGQSLTTDMGMTEGAIAGTAAAIICFSNDATHLQWANEQIDRHRVSVDASDEVFAGSVIPWHPKIFVAHAISARIRRDGGLQSDHEELYRLAAHPLEAVSSTALSEIAACWDTDYRYAWVGLNLGLRLTQLSPHQLTYELDPDARRQVAVNRRDVALAEALSEYGATGALAPWVMPLPTWVLTTSASEQDHEQWQHSGNLWHSQYAAAVLQRVPVAAILANTEARVQFLVALEGFLAWTVDTIDPARRTGGQHERDNPSMYDWLLQLGITLANVAPWITVSEMYDRFLQPISQQSDELAMQLLAPFADVLVQEKVYKADEIRDNILQLLQYVLARVLEHEDLGRSGHHEDRISGFHLPELIKSLLFVSVGGESASTRFSNGRWDDLTQVIPLVDRLVRTAGWNSFVASQFITLCERAGSAYAADTFADQILVQIAEGRLPAAWKGTEIPARIASRVQAIADREHPLPTALARKLLHVLDALVDLGDRRSAALQQSEAFRGVRLEVPLER